MSKVTIVQNDIPHLLHALCNHPDCPEWLRSLIWEEMNERTDDKAYSLEYLTYLFEGSRYNEDCPICDRRITLGYPHTECELKKQRLENCGRLILLPNQREAH